MTTKIQWTQRTWNPATGCTRISPGCDLCYIVTQPPFRMARRRFDGEGPGSTTGVLLHPERLNAPRRWSTPATIFVNSMSDLFHAKIPADYVADVWRVMADTPRHTYQILTKRPERLARVLARVHQALGLAEPLPNVWLGTTVESTDYARRIDRLRAAPAAVRFVSAEPLIGPLDHLDLTGVDWLIAGGESGPVKRKDGRNARPLDEAWIRSLIDQCRTAGTAPFVKQLGSQWAAVHGGHPKGGDPDIWPADLRVREYPSR